MNDFRLIFLGINTLLVVLGHLTGDNDAVDDRGDGTLLVLIAQTAIAKCLLKACALGIRKFMGEVHGAVVDL